MKEINRKIINAFWQANINGKVIDEETIELEYKGSTYNLLIIRTG